MDRKRVTAIGVDRFAEKSTDEIDLSADGSVQLQRDFPPREGGQAAARETADVLAARRQLSAPGWRRDQPAIDAGSARG